MTNQTNAHQVNGISMPKIRCRLIDWKGTSLNIWSKKSSHSNQTNTVCDQNKNEQAQKQDETSVHSALGKAQWKHEALFKKLNIWIKGKTCPHHKNSKAFLDRRGNSTIKSIVQNSSTEFYATVSKIESKKCFTAISTTFSDAKNLSSCHFSTTAGHLGVAKLSEQKSQDYIGREYRKKRNCLSAGV